MTLSACYGGGIYPEDYYDAGSDAEAALCDDFSNDLDDDAHCGAADCDETDPDRNTSALDVPGDGIDQDCSGNDATE
ncbi:MAG: hypothetical protein M3Y87_26980 [Myxococcota bacterium]|nr:hypothetical protein [Myxococcota bacterium]